MKKTIDKSSSVIFMKVNMPGLFIINQERMTIHFKSGRDWR